MNTVLKPLKDLAENWNIDISSSIDEYLEELGHQKISFDGGETGMNFAEAALMVQSCTCIYSKKVEYVHSLLFQVLNLITNKSKEGLKPSVDKDGNDADAEFQNDDDFLSLDDHPEGKNAYMKEDFEEGEKFQLLPQIPMCLLSLEEDEKGDDPLLSKTGELLASRKDFKMNTCRIHTSGTLLLDNSHLEMLKKFKMETESTTQVSNDVLDELPESRNDHEASGLQDAPNDDFPCMDESGDALDCPDPVNGDHMDVDIDALCGGDNQLTDKIYTKKSTQKKPAIDPLKMLDVNEVVCQPKPFVRGKNIIKLCPGLAAVPSRKRKRTKVTPPLEPVKKFINRTCFTQKIPQSVVKNCSLIREFDQLYYKEFKRRKAMEQIWKKKQQEENRLELEGDEEEEDGMEEEHLRLMEPPPEGEDILEDNNDEPLDEDFFDNIDVGRNAGYSDLEQRQDDFEDCDVDSYEDMVRRHVEEFMTSAQEYAQVMDLSKRVSEWEDKIIPKLQEEETRDTFEINRYAGNVIDELEDGVTIKFHRVVQGKPHFEICRTFLATLMLANSGNLRIEERGSFEKGMDKFELQLLSTKRHFEELQEYLAPSMESKGD